MRIDYDLIIGNIIISMNKQIILKEDIYKCLGLIDIIMPSNYYLIGNLNVDDFIEYYNFLFEDLVDKVRIKQNNKNLERYFKIGIPKEIIDFCDMVISKQNEKQLIKRRVYGKFRTQINSR